MYHGLFKNHGLFNLRSVFIVEWIDSDYKQRFLAGTFSEAESKANQYFPTGLIHQITKAEYVLESKS